MVKVCTAAFIDRDHVVCLFCCEDAADGHPAFLGAVRAVMRGGDGGFAHSVGGTRFLQIHPASPPPPAEI